MGFMDLLNQKNFREMKQKDVFSFASSLTGRDTL